MIVLQCCNTIRYVTDIEIYKVNGPCIYAMVNNGHDDLFDLGFTYEELVNNHLFISVKPDLPA